MLGLCCCTRAFLELLSEGYSVVVVCGILIAVASLVVEHRLPGVCSLQELQHTGSVVAACGL